MSENKVTSKLPPILIFGILILLVGFIVLRMIFDDSNKPAQNINTSNTNAINLTDQPVAKTSQATAETTSPDPDEDALKGTMDFYPIKFPLQKPNDPAKSNADLLYTLNAVYVQDVYVAIPRGDKLYYGNKTNLDKSNEYIIPIEANGSYGFDYFAGNPENTIHTMVLAPRDFEKYSFKFNNDKESFEDIQIRFGYGNEDDTYYFMRFQIENDLLNNMQLIITAKGVWLTKGVVPTLFNSDSKFVDTAEPNWDVSINGELATVTVTDESNVKSIKCMVLQKGFKLEEFNEKLLVDYTKPVKVNPATQVLMCKAYDGAGNFTYIRSGT